jgi:hypothetical protein
MKGRKIKKAVSGQRDSAHISSSPMLISAKHCSYSSDFAALNVLRYYVTTHGNSRRIGAFVPCCASNHVLWQDSPRVPGWTQIQH